MKQGNLFDGLYEDQEEDHYDEVIHANANSLYNTSREGVLKQRLITYYKETNGIKRVEKTRNFFADDFSDTTLIEVFK
jgi:hypothetical protein